MNARDLLNHSVDAFLQGKLLGFVGNMEADPSIKKGRVFVTLPSKTQTSKK